jgi:endoribonuclease LACTB2
LWKSNLSTLLTSESARITTCFLTHHHLDHVLGLPDLLLLQPSLADSIYKHPDPPTNAEWKSKWEKALSDAGLTADRIQPLTDGQAFEVPGTNGAVVLRVVHTPGHTDDHVMFLLEEKGGRSDSGRDVLSKDDKSANQHLPAIFTGDAVLGHGTAVFEDLTKYMAGLARAKQVCDEASSSAAAGAGGSVEGDSTTAAKKTIATCGFPAHGTPIADAAAKIGEYIAHRQQREREVLDVLAQSAERAVTAAEIVKVIYANYPVALHEAAEGSVRHVLRKLEAEVRVLKIADGEAEKWKLKEDGKKVVGRAGL